MPQNRRLSSPRSRHSRTKSGLLTFQTYPFEIFLSFFHNNTKRLDLYCFHDNCRYNFKNIELLRRAMTHSSFSEENNKALSILGSNVIATAVSMGYLVENIDISPKELNRHVAEFSQVETSCAVDGKRLGLHKVVRVSPKTDASASSVVCGAFRAVFGAIAIDAKNSDDAGKFFWGVHGSGKVGKAVI